MKLANDGRCRTSWTCAVLALWGAACSSSSQTLAEDPTNAREPRAVQEKQLTDSLRVRAVDYGDGRAAVSIRDSAGQLLFGTEYAPQDETHILVTNKMDVDALWHNDEGVIEDSYFVDWKDTDKFSLDDAVMGAAIIQAQYQRQYRGQSLSAAGGDDGTDDTTGCTIPIIGGAASCSNKGACCDQQDKCYFEFHCDASSWDAEGSASDACKKCNELLKTCLNPFKPAPGPAACCGPTPQDSSCGMDSPKWDPDAPIPDLSNDTPDPRPDADDVEPAAPIDDDDDVDRPSDDEETDSAQASSEGDSDDDDADEDSDDEGSDDGEYGDESSDSQAPEDGSTDACAEDCAGARCTLVCDDYE